MRKNLKEARNSLGLTQKETAAKLKISLRQYQHIEQGLRGGSIRIWDELEDMTGINQRILREKI